MAGRKNDGKVGKTFRLPPDLIEELNERAKSEHTTATQVVQNALTAYLHPESEPVTRKDLGMLFNAIDDVRSALPAAVDEEKKRVRLFGWTLTKGD